MEKIFIKNVLDVDVDGLNGVNHYSIKALYDVVDEEGYATITQELVDEFSYTWVEIKRKGGSSAVNNEINKLYNITV